LMINQYFGSPDPI